MGRKRTAEREQFLADVLTTAVEGGINDWAYVSEYKHEYTPVPVAETFAIVHEVDPSDVEEDDEGYAIRGLRVDIDTIAKGIGVIKSWKAERDFQPNYFGDGGAYWREFLLADRTNGDDGDYDAIVADWIVQAGLFGTIIYG